MATEIPNAIHYWENPLDPNKILKAYQAGLAIRKQREDLAAASQTRDLNQWSTQLEIAKLMSQLGAVPGGGAGAGGVDFGGLSEGPSQMQSFMPGMPEPGAGALPLPENGLGYTPSAPQEYSSAVQDVSPEIQATTPLAARAGIQAATAQPPRPSPSIEDLLNQAFKPSGSYRVQGRGELPNLDIPIFSRQQQTMQDLGQKILMAREQDRLKANPISPAVANVIGQPTLAGESLDPSILAAIVSSQNKNTPAPDRMITIDAPTASLMGGKYPVGTKVPETLVELAVRSQEAGASRAQAASLAGQRMSRMGGLQGIRQASQLRREWNGLDSDFRKVDNQIGILRAAYQRGKQRPGGMADEALIRGFLLLLEPSSVVRESEFAGVQNIGNLAEKFKAKLNAMAGGGGYLSQNERDDLMGMAEAAYKATDALRAQRRQEFSYLADQYGIDPRMIFAASPGAGKGGRTDSGAINIGGGGGGAWKGTGRIVGR